MAAKIFCHAQLDNLRIFTNIINTYTVANNRYGWWTGNKVLINDGLKDTQLTALLEYFLLQMCLKEQKRLTEQKLLLW